MDIDLDDYAAAYDRVHRRVDLDAEWGRVERRVRWRLRGPQRRLWGTLLLIAICVVAGSFGIVTGWMVAAGLVLSVLPLDWADVKESRAELAALESADDVRAICVREAEGRLRDHWWSVVLASGLGVLFVLTGGVAWLLSTDPTPGVAAGLLCLVAAAFRLKVQLPRARRERDEFRD